MTAYDGAASPLPHPPALPARDAYRLWAPGYHVETAVSALERWGVERVTPPLGGRTLLDVGCGTGRRLDAAVGATLRVGVDLVPDMIMAGMRDTPAMTHFAAADARALPLSADAFEVVWCRLVLGHLPDLAPAYAELSRVATANDATLVVTDFHPAAAAAGHTRTFRDASGEVHSIQHHVHPAGLHSELALAGGWRLREHADLKVGPPIRSFYESVDALDRYHVQLGLPLVLMLVFGR